LKWLAHFDAYLRYSDVLILFCCPCRDRGLRREIFDYLILKWRILIHISGILTYRPTLKYILKFCCMRNKAEYSIGLYVYEYKKKDKGRWRLGVSRGRGCAPSLPRKFLMI